MCCRSQQVRIYPYFSGKTVTAGLEVALPRCILALSQEAHGPTRGATDQQILVRRRALRFGHWSPNALSGSLLGSKRQPTAPATEVAGQSNGGLLWPIPRKP